MCVSIVVSSPLGTFIGMENGNDSPQFPFPFPPYAIQEDFMKALYGTLEQGKVGIFESPTGTVSMYDIIITLS